MSSITNGTLAYEALYELPLAGETLDEVRDKENLNGLSMN